MVRNNFLLVCLVAFCVSCKNANSSLDVPFLSGNLSNVNFILVVPDAGCNGCISEAEKFVVQNCKTLKNVLFVFTNIKSKKQLKLRVGDSVYYHPMVIIDTINKYADNSSNNIYPKIFYLQKGNVEKVEYQSPMNPSAIERLKMKINLSL